MEPGLSSVASLGVYLATRTAPAPRGRAVRDLDRLIEALDRGALAIDDTVRIAGITTTVGRHLVAACLPPSLRAAADAPWDAARGARELARIIRELHVEIAGRCVEALETLGQRIAARSGLSLAQGDFLPPAGARAAIDEAHRDAARIADDCFAGRISDAERFHDQCDTWSHARAIVELEARRDAPEHDPLAACAASQREPVQPEVLRSPRGTIRVPFGDHVVMHMAGTLGDGLGTHEYFVRTVEARRTTLDAAARQQIARALLADLDAAIGDIEIVAVDCGTTRGVEVCATVFEEDEPGSLADKLAGAVAAEDVRDRAGAVIARAGAVLSPELARRIEAARIAAVVLRDVRTCEASGGVCAWCFGLAPEDALWTCAGDPVGARAAATIATAASRIALGRIYHIC